MDDLEIIVPNVSTAWKTEAFGAFERLVVNIFSDAYRAGYMAGHTAAVNRVIGALGPTGPLEDHTTEPATNKVWTPLGKEPGAKTHRLIEYVMSGAGAKGATPMEVYKSPANKDPKVSRSGIFKVLKRGTKPGGRYVSLGGGRYTKAATK